MRNSIELVCSFRYFILGLALSFMIASPTLSGKQEELQEPRPLNASKPQRRTFVLKDKPEVREQRGGDHGGLFPLAQEWSYIYKGKLVADAKTFTVDIKICEPVALFAYGNDYYLLSLGYFDFWKDRYVWLRADAQLHLSPKGYAENHPASDPIPEALFLVHLDDSAWTAAYQVWIVRVFLRKEPAKQFCWFHKYVTLNARFTLDAVSDGNKWAGETGSLEDEMMRYAKEPKEQERLYNDLLTLLRNSRATDYVPALRGLYYELWEIDPVRSKKDIFEYVGKVESEKVESDARVEAYRSIGRNGHGKIYSGGNDVFIRQ